MPHQDRAEDAEEAHEGQPLPMADEGGKRPLKDNDDGIPRHQRPVLDDRDGPTDPFTGRHMDTPSHCGFAGRGTTSGWSLLGF